MLIIRPFLSPDASILIGDLGTPYRKEFELPPALSLVIAGMVVFGSSVVLPLREVHLEVLAAFGVVLWMMVESFHIR